MLQNEWVTVKATTLEIVAEMMRARLEAEGVESVLRGNRVASTAGVVNELNTSWSNPLGGVEVRVRVEDAARAREILAETSDEAPPRRAAPFAVQVIQFFAAVWFASLAFYCGVAVTSNLAAGFGTAFIAFVVIFILGNRRT